jgi:hypothetical protein
VAINPALQRIVRGAEGRDVLQWLAEELAPTDLQSLLLEVYRLRADQQTPASVLAHYERSRFVRPSPIAPAALLAVDRLAFACADPLFEPLELAPVCPLGTSSVVASVGQDKAVSTSRNSEVVSDSTNVLALECALRRRARLRSVETQRQWVRLCASHRLLRPQLFSGPASFAHFRLFALCTAGRASADYGFERDALAEQLRFYLDFFAKLPTVGYHLEQVRVHITDLMDEAHSRDAPGDIMTLLAQEFADVEWVSDPERRAGRNYYSGLCFAIYAKTRAGAEHFLVDGGFTTWTQELLSNRKERLLISGIGSERLCSEFGTVDAVDSPANA